MNDATICEELRPKIKTAKKWLKSLFGENPPFDPEIAVDSNGTVLIDKGRSKFIADEQLGFYIFPLERGKKGIHCLSFEEAVFLATLDSVREHFANHYPR